MSPHIQNRSMTVRRRVINDHTNDLISLSRTLSQLSDSVDGWWNNLNSKWLNIIDYIAPIKVKTESTMETEANC